MYPSVQSVHPSIYLFLYLSVSSDVVHVYACCVYLVGGGLVNPPGRNVATQGSEAPDLLAAYEDSDSKAGGLLKKSVDVGFLRPKR